MSLRYLPDTSFRVDALRDGMRLPAAIEKSETVYLSEVAIGEFKAGLDDTRRGRRNREALEAFLRLPNVVDVTITSATTDLYAKVFRSLHAAGRPIPVNDIRLAAKALEHGAVLVSRSRHFEAVANLRTLTPDD